MAAIKTSKSPKAKQSPKFKGVTKAKVQDGKGAKISPAAIAQAIAENVQTKSQNKITKPAEKVEKFAGTVGLDATPGAKRRSGVAGNVSPAKVQKVKKAATTKKAKKPKAPKETIMRKVGKLYVAKKFDELKTMLPVVKALIEKTKQRESKKSLRTLRQLNICVKKINGTYLEQGQRPKRMVQVSSDPESVDGDTISEKITKAAEEADSDEDSDFVAEGDSDAEDNVNTSNIEEESDEEDEDEDEADESETPTPKAKAQGQTPNSANGKKTRYVVFVGNLNYETTEEQIAEHFKKAGPTVSVRVAKNPGTNVSKGFAHVDFADEESYQKALSMHHSFLNNRRINVEYSGAAKNGKDKKQQGKKLKIEGMRDQGMLAGGERKINNRTLRRKKAAAAKAGNTTL